MSDHPAASHRRRVATPDVRVSPFLVVCVVLCVPSLSQTTMSRTPSRTQSTTQSQLPSAGTVSINGNLGGDAYGASVALSKNGLILVVGATNYSNGAGTVYVHPCTAPGICIGMSTATVQLTMSSSIGFGESVAVSGDGTVIAVGCSRCESGGNWGIVVIYSCNVAGSLSCALGSIMDICCGGLSGTKFGSVVALSVRFVMTVFSVAL